MSENKKHTTQEILQKDLEAIYIGNLGTVDANLIFPSEGKYGSTFTWSTGESRFIDENGEVQRPLHGMGNRKVTLTVVASYEGETAMKEFVATVLQEEKIVVVKKVRDTNVCAKPGEMAKLPSVAIVDCEDGRKMTLLVAWEVYEPLKEEGELTVKGTIENTDKIAVANICYCNEEKTEDGPEELVKYFPINDVKLLEGTVYYEYQQKMTEFLLAQNDDQMLYNFRVACGLDTLGAPPMTGWDEESCKLKGHTTGHYLSGLAVCYGATHNERILNKIHYMVTELKKCQDEFAKYPKQYHEGFLSAYSEEQFDLLEVFVKYPEIWSPYYTLEKIMSGLYDCYEIAGEETAREILEPLGVWVYNRLSRLPKETLNKMWSMYIAGEYGGMIGIMVKVYLMSGNEKHLQAARLFDNEKLFYPMAENCDTLEDMHANQHIPQIMGAMEMYHATGEVNYWKIGKNFWEIVTGGHIYCNGGFGETEMIHRAGTTCSYLSEKSEESCVSYNMLRLTGQIFAYTADGTMMNYYDNTLRNHILTSCSHEADGGTTYFMPLNPGGCKEYSTTENTCCHGTGMESRYRFMENIYAYDDNYVYVNVLVDSALDGKLELKTVEEGKIRLTALSDMDKNLKLFVPKWAYDTYSVSVNGANARTTVEKGFVTLQALKAGDVVVLEMAMEFRYLENNSDNTLVNIAYGPYILAAVSEETDFLKAPALCDLKATDKKLHFEADGVEFMPFALVDLEPHHVYYRK